MEDQVLTASNTLADEDGLGELTYEWKRDGVAIDGATGAIYTLIQADVSKAITVTASYTDGFGNDHSKISAASIVSKRAVSPRGPLSLPASLKDRSHRTVIKSMQIHTGRADVAVAQDVANFGKRSACCQRNAGEAVTIVGASRSREYGGVSLMTSFMSSYVAC